MSNAAERHSAIATWRAKQAAGFFAPETVQAMIEAGVGDREKRPRKPLARVTQDVFDALPPRLTGRAGQGYDPIKLQEAEITLQEKLGSPPYARPPESFMQALEQNDPQIHAGYTAAYRALISARLVRGGCIDALPIVPNTSGNLIEKLTHVKPILPGEAIDAAAQYWGAPVQTHLVAESLYETHRQLIFEGGGQIPVWRFPRTGTMRLSPDSIDYETFSQAVAPRPRHELSNLSVDAYRCSPPPPPNASPEAFKHYEKLSPTPAWDIESPRAGVTGMNRPVVPIADMMVVAGPVSALPLRSCFAQLKDILIVGEEGLRAALATQSAVWSTMPSLQEATYAGVTGQFWVQEDSGALFGPDIRATQMSHTAMQLYGADMYDMTPGLRGLREKLSHIESAIGR